MTAIFWKMTTLVGLGLQCRGLRVEVLYQISVADVEVICFLVNELII